MAKHITIPYSESGFYRAATWLEDYAKYRLPKYCLQLIDSMCKVGEDYAINNLTRIDTGETLTSIAGYRNGDKGVIVAGGAAIWIEFGTGVYYNGAGYDYPIPVDGIVGHGEYGWGYGSNPNGWFYKNEDGEWKHTRGLPAGHFMYNAMQSLRRDCPDLAKEVFK